jgi:hypothetical protein
MILGSPTGQYAHGADTALRAASYRRVKRSLAPGGNAVLGGDCPHHGTTQDHLSARWNYFAGRQLDLTGWQSRAAGRVTSPCRMVKPGCPTVKSLCRPARFSHRALKPPGFPVTSLRNRGEVNLPPGRMIPPAPKDYPAVPDKHSAGQEKSTCRAPFTDQQAAKQTQYNTGGNTTYGQIRLSEGK